MSELKDRLEALKHNPHFNEVYLTRIQKHFDEVNAKLRYKNGKVRTDFSYGRLCGELDGLEYALNLVDREIEENTEPQGE